MAGLEESEATTNASDDNDGLQNTAGKADWARARMPPVAEKKWFHVVSFYLRTTTA